MSTVNLVLFDTSVYIFLLLLLLSETQTVMNIYHNVYCEVRTDILHVIPLTFKCSDFTHSVSKLCAVYRYARKVNIQDNTFRR